MEQCRFAARRQDFAMTFKPAVWFPIAALLSGLNLVAVAFTAGPDQPLHAMTHAALALGFGLWAFRLRQGTGGGNIQARLDAIEGDMSRLEALDAEVGMLRHELSEAQERLDFAERLLAQNPDARRVGPQP
jgi:hypothetical protein